MSSRPDDIINLRESLKRETQSHLKQKAAQSRKLANLAAEETELSEKIAFLNEMIESGNTTRIETSLIDISHLLQNKNQILDEINSLEKELDLLKKELTRLKIELSSIDSRIDFLKQEKNEHAQSVISAQRQQSKVQLANIKVKNEQQRNKKFQIQVDNQKRILNNLKSFLRSFDLIEHIILNYSPLAESEATLSPEVSDEILQLIISAKSSFDAAQTKFDSNAVIPFLIDADQAYKNAIAAFVKLTDEIPNSLLENEFENQVLTLVSKGLDLNTRHLNAVNTMLSKLEKGVEIAPLASFSNEVRDYFIKNLTILRITGSLLTTD
ncbi:MAG: hypothetical protein ACFFAJ_04030 [Candidatus Hodarchaeota archaeon]